MRSYPNILAAAAGICVVVGASCQRQAQNDEPAREERQVQNDEPVREQRADVDERPVLVQRAGRMKALGRLPVWGDYRAYDISADGSVIVGFGTGDKGLKASAGRKRAAWRI